MNMNAPFVGSDKAASMNCALVLDDEIPSTCEDPTDVPALSNIAPEPAALYACTRCSLSLTSLLQPFSCKHPVCRACLVAQTGAAALKAREEKRKMEGVGAYDEAAAPGPVEHRVDVAGRLTLKPKGRWGYTAKSVDRLSFSVDRAADFVGCGLFASAITSFTGTVTLYQGDNESNAIGVLKFNIPRMNSALEPQTVKFAHPVRLMPKEVYTLSLKVTSSGGSGCGYMGLEKVTTAGGITITFSNALESSNNNGTDIQHGQFPFVLLSPAAGAGHIAKFQSPSISVCRFTPSPHISWGYYGDADSISFEVSKPIELTGIGMYCGKPGVCTGQMEIRKGSGEALFAQAIQWESQKEGAVQIEFEQAVALSANQTYTIAVKVTSRFLTIAGHHGKPEVSGPDGTQFRFCSVPGGNGTCVEIGQIPELFYQPKAVSKLETPDFLPVVVGCPLSACAGKATLDVGSVYTPDELQPKPAKKCANFEVCKQTADALCANCGEVFCSLCWPTFHSVGALRLHAQLPVEAASAKASAPMMCPHHPSKFLDGYCNTDKQLVCDHCLIYGAHKGHDGMLLKDKLIAMKTSIESDLRPVEYTMKRLRNCASTASSFQVTLRQQEGEAVASLQKLRLELHSALEERLDKLERQVHNIAAGRCQALSGQERECTAMSNAIEAKMSTIRSLAGTEPSSAQFVETAVAALVGDAACTPSDLTPCTVPAVQVDMTWAQRILASIKSEAVVLTPT